MRAQVLRALLGCGVGAIAGALVGALAAGFVAIVDADKYRQIGFLSFLAIFAVAGIISGAIQWWGSSD
jgi:hypothetical protein